MAWNQPGGNGDKEPWGDRGGKQGPPDLDELLKNLQGKLAGIFGGGRPGGGRIGGGKINFGGGGSIGLGLILVVALIGWAVAGVYIVDQAEQGVVLRFGKFTRTTEPGPHWLPYFAETVEKVNVQQLRSQDVGFRSAGGSQSSVPNESLMLTEDENIIDIKFAVQYRVSEPNKYLFNVLDADNTLRQATESAVREIVGKNGMDFVITEGREAVASRAEVLIQDILDRYGTGLLLTSVNMQSAQPPKEVQEAFFDAVKAREDQVRLENEARAYKADIVPKAEGEANAILERAEGYKQRVVAQAEGETDRFLKVLIEYQKAPEVTRSRLYLEAVESVMANTSKVLVDLDGGNNLVYLPLDKLIGSRTEESGAASGQRSIGSVEESSSSPIDSRRRRLDNRGRGR